MLDSNCGKLLQLLPLQARNTHTFAHAHKYSHGRPRTNICTETKRKGPLRQECNALNTTRTYIIFIYISHVLNKYNEWKLKDKSIAYITATWIKNVLD